MLDNFLLKGCGTALVTPFLNGAVDYEAYRLMVKRQIDRGIDFLVPLGSTAETPCLVDDEKKKIVTITKELCEGRPIVVGCGTNSLNSTIANIKMLEPFGPDAFLVVVPYYNKPTQAGLYEYFKAVAESTSKGIVVYNVPGRTGTNMAAQTTLKIAELPNVIGVKEASGNIDQVLEIRKYAPANFSVLSGEDNQTFPLMAGGAQGVVSVASNIAPAMMSHLTHLLLAGEMGEALVLDNKLKPLYKDCFVESNPIPAKGALSLLGLCTPEMRLPLTTATAETMELMKKVVGLYE
jgi:hypothetical protein